MKTLIFFSIFFCTIALPTFAELTPQDLDRIRLVVKEELAPIEADLAQLDERLRNVEIAVGSLTGRVDGVEKQILHGINITYGLIALIVAAIAIPQLILTLRSGKDRQQERINQELRAEIETLKQQQIIRP